MTSRYPIRTAIVGFGFSGRRIAAPLLAALPQYQLSAFVTRSPDSQALAASEYPAAAILPSMDALAERSADFDLVVVGTPDDSHFAVAGQAIEAGLNVVVDKPFTASSAEAVDLIGRADERGLLATAFQNKRWDADFLTLAQLADAGTLGELTRYDAWIARWSPTIGPTWREQARPGTLDGRLADLGSHLVDQAVSLLGPVARVYAELDQRRPGAHTNDDVFLALTHANGVRTHLHLGSVTSHPTPTFQLQGLAGSFVTRGLDGQFAALAAGIGPLDDAWRDYDTWSGELRVGDDVAPFAIADGDWRDFYSDISDVLLTGRPAAVQPETVVHVLRVLEAAVESHRTRAVVEVS